MRMLLITICLLCLVGCSQAKLKIETEPPIEVTWIQMFSNKELVDVIFEYNPKDGKWYAQIGSSKTNIDKANEAISTLANAVIALSAAQ